MQLTKTHDYSINGVEFRVDNVYGYIAAKFSPIKIVTYARGRVFKIEVSCIIMIVLKMIVNYTI
jgi:hypothetical protein